MRKGGRKRKKPKWEIIKWSAYSNQLYKLSSFMYVCVSVRVYIRYAIFAMRTYNSMHCNLHREMFVRCSGAHITVHGKLKLHVLGKSPNFLAIFVLDSTLYSFFVSWKTKKKCCVCWIVNFEQTFQSIVCTAIT